MRIGVLCSGGDAPGMNPCLRAIVRYAIVSGDEVVGIQHGYKGLLEEDFYIGANGTMFLGPRDVSGLSNRGGTFLGSSRCTEFTFEEGKKKAAAILDKHKIDALIPIGGNGTLTGALDLTQYWKGQIIGIPGTIDNDLLGTDRTIGFDTAIQTAVEAIDKLRDTAGSHDMMFIVEVMGRHCGDLAFRTAIAGGCEIVAIPEIPTKIEDIVERLNFLKSKGKKSMIMAVAEGDDLGSAYDMLYALKKAGSPYEMRVVVLGHIQRGGSPIANDRILAVHLGCRAVKALREGITGKMVGIKGEQTILTDLQEVIADHKKLSVDTTELLNLLAN